MPRGGSLNAPTVADAAGVAAAPPAAIPKLPPARHHRQYETTEPAKRKTGLEPWLVALVLIAMALGGLTEINGTWLRQKLAALKPTAGVQPQPTSAPSATPQVTARPAAPTAAPDINEKPSPAGPPDQSHSTQTQAAKPAISPEIPDIEAPTPKARVKQPTVAREVKRTPARQLEPVEQEVTITSSPGGATATLDGDPHVTCKTPCTLEALPGRHTIAVTMPGYDVEHREVEVGTNSVEIPTVGLRSLGGTLYLASEPTGASISINGKKYSQVTNAQIPLPPGTYTVTVEKNGKQNTQTVTVQNGRLNLVKIPLE